MKATETLNKIANLLNVDLSAQEEVKLEQMRLENGTVIEAEAFEAGEAVFIVTEDERVALPIGDYELENGMTLIVAEEGVIAEIREGEAEEPAEEPVAEEEVEAAEEEKEEEMAYATKEELGSAIDELKGMIDEIKAMMAPKEEEMAEEKLSAQKPAAKPIKANPEAKQPANMKSFAHQAKGTTLDRVLAKIAQR
jgi:hypothetical protein